MVFVLALTRMATMPLRHTSRVRPLTWFHPVSPPLCPSFATPVRTTLCYLSCYCNSCLSLCGLLTASFPGCTLSALRAPVDSRLYQKPANYELPEDDVRQLTYELETQYNTLMRTLRSK